MAIYTSVEPARKIRRITHVVVIGILLSVAVFLAFRRSVGALSSTIPPLVICATTAVLACLLAALRAFVDNAWRRSPLLIIPIGAIIGLLGFSVSLPDTAVWPLCFFWAILALEEGFWLLPRYRLAPGADREQRETATTAPAAESRNTINDATGGDTEPPASEEKMLLDEGSEAPSNESLPLEEESASLEAFEEELEKEVLLEPGVTQQVSQMLDDQGRAAFAGLLRADWQKEERQVVLHVAFCPPLKQLPTIEVYQLDGPSSTIKVTELQVYGTRIEIRRTGPFDDADEAVLQFETGYEA